MDLLLSVELSQARKRHYYCTLNVAATFVKFAMLPPMINTFPVKHYFGGKKMMNKPLTTYSFG